MKTITIDEIIKKLFGDGETPDWGTPASDIYEYQFELEVTVEDADWIENDGWGCSRPNQDYENEDLTKKEIIKVNADSLIKSEFREDFIAHLYTEDLKNGEITIEELEKWINSKEKRKILKGSKRVSRKEVSPNTRILIRVGNFMKIMLDQTVNLITTHSQINS